MLISHENFKQVQDITARDSIDIKIRGLRVQVQDASSDTRTNGSAIYTWDGSTWILENEDNEILSAPFTSNDPNLDTFQEMVDYVKALQTQIDTVNAELNMTDFYTNLG